MKKHNLWHIVAVLHLLTAICFTAAAAVVAAGWQKTIYAATASLFLIDGIIYLCVYAKRKRENRIMHDGKECSSCGQK